MSNAPFKLADSVSERAQEYLATRLDGARDLYLLALALGSRRGGWRGFGHMVREARIHFAAVIEEARIAGFETNEIQSVLSQHGLAETLRPEVWEQVEAIVKERRRE